MGGGHNLFPLVKIGLTDLSGVAMAHPESLAPTGLYVGVVFSIHLHITKRYSTDMVNLSLKQSGSLLYGFFKSIVHVSNCVRFLP